MSMNKPEMRKFIVDLAKRIHTAGIVGDMETNWVNANIDARKMAMAQSTKVLLFLKESEIL